MYLPGPGKQKRLIPVEKQQQMPAAIQHHMASLPLLVNADETFTEQYISMPETCSQKLARLFAPRSIAFVGGAIAEMSIQRCLEMGYAGELIFILIALLGVYQPPLHFGWAVFHVLIVTLQAVSGRRRTIVEGSWASESH